MNKKFLKIYKEMLVFVNSAQENNRSSHKMNKIYDQIAKDVQKKLGDEYTVIANETTRKEEKIQGRYFEKKVNIVIKKNKRIISGIAIKIPLNSYLKNKINYFENMLGETANIKSNGIMYFQIIIFPYKIPDWKGKGKDQLIRKMDEINVKKLELYLKLNHDEPLKMYHTPSKTLILIIQNNVDDQFHGETKEEYRDFFIKCNNDNDLNLRFIPISLKNIEKSLIINNYSKYIEKISYLIKGNS